MNAVVELSRSQVFADLGYACEQFGRTSVVVVDPARHPLGVWVADRRSTLTYANTGLMAGVVASNGPVMGRRMALLGKVSKRRLVQSAAISGLAGAALVAAVRPRRRRTLFESVTGGLVCANLSAAALLRRWEPCGQVVHDGQRSLRTFDGEGPCHAFFARVGSGFYGHVIGDGHPPEEAIVGLGGMVRLVRQGAVSERGCDCHRPPRRPLVDAASRPSVGWGLLPTGSGEGLVVAAGGRGVDLRELAKFLVSLGIVDAVASDPSGCAMLSCDGRHLIGPPPFHRRAIQRYGLFCGARQ